MTPVPQTSSVFKYQFRIGNDSTVSVYPVVHFWLHLTVHCTERIDSVCLRASSASAERVGEEEVGGVVVPFRDSIPTCISKYM